MMWARLLVSFLAAAALVGCGSESAGVGPLAASVKYATAVTSPVDIGKPASFGILLENPGSRALTIDRSVALGAQGPIVVDDIVIARHPNGIVGTALGFPPRVLGTPIHPVHGWIIPAHSRAFQLIVGAHMTKAGRAQLTKIRVEYHVGHTHYAVNFPYSMGECAPNKDWPKGCPEIPLPN